LWISAGLYISPEADLIIGTYRDGIGYFTLLEVLVQNVFDKAIQFFKIRSGNKTDVGANQFIKQQIPIRMLTAFSP
jgi:hypothetical protein